MKKVVRDGEVIVIIYTDERVVQLLSEGKTIAEVAGEMNVNVRTMEARIGRLKKKTECSTLPHLVATFLRNKLID